MDRIRVDTIEEIKLCFSRGFNPLLNDKLFYLPIDVRIEAQNIIFGKFEKGIQRANNAFYLHCWEWLPHICEETIRPLNKYSSVHVSHILTKGAHPEMAHDPRNVNILTLECHNKWENGRREEMRIYDKNMRTIEKLLKEYRGL